MIKTGQTIIAADFVQEMTAGENLTANDAVYLKASDGKVYKCDADDRDKRGFIGFAQETVSTNASVNIILNGIMTGLSGLTAGTIYYLSGTAGALSATPPADPVIAGIALSSTVLKIVHGADYQLFTSSGTWTKPPYGVVAYIKGWGGGGGGGRGAGGGAGYNEVWKDLSDLGATETVTIGAAGTGSSGDGSAGGDTTFGAHLTAYGGGGGSTDSGNNGAGGGGGSSLSAGQTLTGAGTASGGSPYGGSGGASGSGSNGSDGKFGWGGGGGNGCSNAAAGNGGDSLWGGGGGGGGRSVFGGNGGNSGNDGGGTAGSVPGGGGGGNRDSGSGKNGGAGQLIIIVM